MKVTVEIDGVKAVFESEESFATFLKARGSTRNTTRVPLSLIERSAPPRPPSPVQDALLDALSVKESQTTRQLIERMESAGYVFQASDPIIALNSALLALQQKGLAHVEGTVPGNPRQKLWLKGPKGD